MIFFAAIIICVGITWAISRQGLGFFIKGWGGQGFFKFLLYYAALIVVHELIHGAGFMLVGKAKKEDIKFGSLLCHGMFYCHSEKPLGVRAYIITLLLPVLLTGFIPFLFIMFSGSFFWAIFAVFAISSGAGDMIMAWELRKLPNDAVVLDHDKLPGYYILYDEDNLPVAFEEEDVNTKEIAEMYLGNRKRNYRNDFVKFIKFLLLWGSIGVIVGLLAAALNIF